MLGLGLRAIGAFLRFSAPVDALVYHEEGSRIAPALRGLDFGVDTGRPIPGTGWIRYVSGITHAFVIDDMFVTFLIFTFLSFIGVYLCYLAFVRAVPEGDHRRYALLLFLWPSLLFWPSSIGKEAWMLFGIGVTVLGRGPHRHRPGGDRARRDGRRAGDPVARPPARGPHDPRRARRGPARPAEVALHVPPHRPHRHRARPARRRIDHRRPHLGGPQDRSHRRRESISTALEETQEQTDQGGAQFESAIVRIAARLPRGLRDRVVPAPADRGP